MEFAGWRSLMRSVRTTLPEHPRYVEPVIEEESMTIDQAIANLKDSLNAAYAAEDRLKELLLGRD